MMEGRASAVSEARFARDANAMVAMLSKRLRTVGTLLNPVFLPTCGYDLSVCVNL